MNNKLAKNAITKFCNEHHTGIVDAAMITIPIVANATLVGIAYHLYKKYPKIVNDSDIVESNEPVVAGNIISLELLPVAIFLTKMMGILMYVDTPLTSVMESSALTKP